jgi:biotin carboxyl carrier protein
VCAGFTASVWDIKVKEGDTVAKGDTVVVLEAMKMESPVVAPVAGTIKAIVAEQGAMAAGGQLLLVIEVAAPS